MARAQMGDFEGAVRRQQALITTHAARADVATLDRWRANLERYQAGLVCCAGQPR